MKVDLAGLVHLSEVVNKFKDEQKFRRPHICGKALSATLMCRTREAASTAERHLEI